MRRRLRLESFSHHYPETVVAAAALPLAYGASCSTDVSHIQVFGEGLQGDVVTLEGLRPAERKRFSPKLAAAAGKAFGSAQLAEAACAFPCTGPRFARPGHALRVKLNPD